MIHYIVRDITTVERGIVGHGCNCQGVMGSGVAFAIRKRWPSVYDNYVHLCEVYNKSRDMLGMIQLVGIKDTTDEILDGGKNMLFVANMFTQHRYGTDKPHAEVEAVKGTVNQVVHMASLVELPLYMPRIGCGLGGLNWERDVQSIVEAASEEYPNVDIYVCDL